MTDDPALPHPALLLEARDWLRGGCPLVMIGVDTQRARRTLMALLEQLPSHFDRYCYGTDTNRRLMLEEPA